MTELANVFVERGDLAHLALFLWASGSSALLVLVLKELIAQVRRFDAFVSEISHLNQRLNMGASASAESDNTLR
jgi:hypothetical protein